MRQHPIAGAITISHLRALNEAVTEVPKAEAIIVLECDVEIIQNIITLFAGFIANWFANKALETILWLGMVSRQRCFITRQSWENDSEALVVELLHL